MEQLTQELKSGKMQIKEVPFPLLNRGQVLVRNYYSVISPGTEGKTVSDARKSYIAKARSRQKEVKMTIDLIKSEGLRKAYDLVMNKLETLSPLGYSCAGEIIAVGEGVRDLFVGDKVACGGGGAYHADVVAVSRNLCVKIPSNINLSHAAFAAIASIAIQGIRQSDLRFGENCVVIGLGLIGLLTIQILKAAGIKAVGVDINEYQVNKAKEMGADLAILRNKEGIKNTIIDFTNGYGTDAVIIAAGTNSNDPVEFAGEICRNKGKVVIVGAVPTGFSRSNYYKKELDLRMSSSYGPGRYDPVYEEMGVDYPIGYVRFTENRNMQSFIHFLSEGKIDIQKIITHSFTLNDASDAYNLILEKKEPVIGVLIKYDIEKRLKRSFDFEKKLNKFPDVKALNVSFIGAGNFAQNAILPRISDKCSFQGVITSRGNISRYVAEKYGFKYCTDNLEKILNDPNTGTIFIVTRHNTHAEFCASALRAGKNVFIEKPLALNFDELEKVKLAYEDSNKSLMLGFNRRFSPITQKLKSYLSDKSKKAITIRINAGALPPEHWVNNPEIGGGRILGEVCHFIDLAGYIASSKVVRISSSVLRANPQLQDTVLINIEYTNGSIASINYFSNGNKNVPKEQIEVFSDGIVYLINDFKTMVIYTATGTKKIKLKTQDKGHTAQFNSFLRSLQKGDNFAISFDEIYHSSFVTLEAIRSIKEKRVIEIF